MDGPHKLRNQLSFIGELEGASLTVYEKEYTDFLQVLRRGNEAPCGAIVEGDYFSSTSKMWADGGFLEMNRTKDRIDGLLYPIEFWQRLYKDLREIDFSDFSKSSDIWADPKMRYPLRNAIAPVKSLSESLFAPRSISAICIG
jgi:hypothetical protein